MKTEKKINYNSIYSNQQYLKVLNKFYNHNKNHELLQTYRNSSLNINQNKNKNEIPYSIKPLHCSVPKDVSLHKIFVNMMTSSFKINQNKSIYSKMSEEDLDIRNNILNRIKIFLNKNSIPKKILCSIIFLYDILTIKNREKKILSDFEEIGIGAAVLSIKFLCGKKKSFLSLKNFSKIFQNEKKPKNINEIEINSLKLLNYYLSFASPISFMEIFFINGIIFINDKIKTEESSRIYDLVIELMERIMIISNEYIKHNPLCLCSCLVSYAREIYHLEKWPQVLTQAFGVNFYSFENIYNEFHELIIPSKKKDYSKEIINNNIHKKEKTGIDEDVIGDDQNEIKLNPSSSVVQNLISTKKFKTPIKMENEKQKKYINIYYNNNYAYSHNKNTTSDMFNKNTKSKLLKNEYFDYYDRGITDENLNQKKKIEEMEIEIPSLNHKKNNSLRHIYENKLKDNSNKANKLNQRICTNNKEEEYSNLATCENSNNYNKSNIKKKYEKKYIFSYNIDEKDINSGDSNNNNLYENIITPINSQKKSQKNYSNRWGSIKKYCKLKNGNYSKESFFPLTESKTLYIKKVYK